MSKDYNNVFDIIMVDDHKELSRVLNIEPELKSELNASGWSLLMVAAWIGASECVKVLIDLEANVYFRDRQDWSALHFAAYNGFPEICQKLIEAELDLDDLTNERDTPLMLAKENGHPETVAYLQSVISALEERSSLSEAVPVLPNKKKTDRHRI